MMLFSILRSPQSIRDCPQVSPQEDHGTAAPELRCLGRNVQLSPSLWVAAAEQLRSTHAKVNKISNNKTCLIAGQLPQMFRAPGFSAPGSVAQEPDSLH